MLGPHFFKPRAVNRPPFLFFVTRGPSETYGRGLSLRARSCRPVYLTCDQHPPVCFIWLISIHESFPDFEIRVTAAVVVVFGVDLRSTRQTCDATHAES